MYMGPAHYWDRQVHCTLSYRFHCALPFPAAMQSFLQFRRLREVAQKQIDRKQNDSTAHDDLERGDSTSALHLSTASDETKYDSNEEIVKGEELVEEPGLSGINDEEDDDDDEGHDEKENKERRLDLSRATTQQSDGVALGQSLTGVEVRRRTSNEPGDGKTFVVSWQGDADPENPHNWSAAKRMRPTLLIVCIAFIVGMAGSIDSGALKPAAQEFGVAEVVESGATGLFLVGFGVGALFAGPFSEVSEWTTAVARSC